MLYFLFTCCTVYKMVDLVIDTQWKMQQNIKDETILGDNEAYNIILFIFYFHKNNEK